MSREETKNKVQEVFRELFEDDTIIISDSTTSNDIEMWDSLMHINLINDLEACFGITFSTEEVINSKNVGELIDSIYAKIK